MEQFLTAADAARILGVVPATVRQMALSGRLPALRTEGGVRLFRRDDVERLKAERETHRPSVTTKGGDPMDREEARS
jgi:excisionase family DNA binding protein